MIHFDIPSLEKNLKTLEAETTKPEFWEDSQNSNKVLSKIKNIKGKCQKCTYKMICGGCRATALALKKSLLEEDPLCLL